MNVHSRRFVELASALLLLTACSSRGDYAGPEGPALLSETGLYTDVATETLADGVLTFAPRFELWSDSSEKRRFLFVPDGTTIDTSSVDDWRFPVGTKAWKEFARDGTRVETRLLEKVGPGDWEGEWVRVAYLWNDDETDALAVPEGERNAAGTPHDVPSSSSCQWCHDGAEDTLIGVSALLLDDGTGSGESDLDALADLGLLSDAVSTPLVLPGDATAVAALGTLHANCGSCHNARNDELPLRTWLTVATLTSVEATPTYETSVDAETMVEEPLGDTAATTIIVPGDPAASLLHIRMLRRGDGSGAMPPLASEQVDQVGADAVEAWISSL